jgi:WD40 repeat protein
MPATGRDEYDAFLSYSRAADEGVARALQRGLQRFTKPWYRTRALRVFLDDSSLSANPGLWPSLQQALDASRFFVLLASPESAASPWVRREITYWLTCHPVDQLLIALTAGDVVWDRAAGGFDQDASSALAPALHGRFAEEPRHVDLRWARTADDLSLSHHRFAQAVADLAAPMHGRPKDELFGEDVVQHRRTVRIATLAAVGLAALAVVAVAAGIVAVQQRDAARAQQRVAVSRQLAAEASMELERQPDRALLLSLESLAVQPALHGRDALLTSLQRVSAARAYLDNGPPVLSLAYHPDGTLLATGHDDGTVRLWDVAQNRPLTDPIGGHELLVEALAFSPDGDLLAAVSRDGAVVLREPRSGGAVVRQLGDSVLGLAFSPDGSRLATGDSVGEIRFWDVATGRPVGGPVEVDGRVHRMAWSPAGAPVAVVTTDGAVTLVDPGTGEVVGRPATRTGSAVRSVAFDRNGTSLALGDVDGTIDRFDLVEGGRLGEPIAAHAGAVLSLASLPTAGFLASAGGDGTAVVWDLARGEPYAVYRGHGDEVRAVAVRPDGEQVATGGFDGGLVLWQPEDRLVTPITSNEQGLVDVAASGDASRLVFGYASGDVFVWDLPVVWDRPATGPSGGALRAGDHVPRTLALSPDGDLAATGDGAGRFVVWDLDERQAVGAPLQSPESALLDLLLLSALLDTDSDPETFRATFEQAAFSPDATRLATVSGDTRVALWDTRTQRQVGEPLAGSRGPIASLAFSPDGTTLAAGDLTGQVVLWDAGSGEPRGAPLSGPQQNVESLAFDPAGDRLAAGLADGSVVLWDLARRAPVGEPLPGLTESVVALAFSPDAGLLAGGSADGVVALWDVPARRPLGVPVGWHAGRVQTLVFAQDGRRLLSGASDGTASWDVDPSSWAAMACSIANRALTPAEWAEVLGDRPYRPACRP